jgi:iron complex outermembrane recepter protein
MFRYITLLIVLASVYSQSISGFLKNERGENIAGANIFLKNQNIGDASDWNGYFHFSVKKNGNYTLVISSVGYIRYEQTIFINNEDIQLNTVVLKDEIIKSGEVLVSSERLQNLQQVSINKLQVKAIDMPSSTASVNAKLIQEQQSLRLSETLSNVAGVYMFNQGFGGTSETIGARGLSLRYLGFMFRDGARFGTNQRSGATELSFYEKVEVLKGGAAINFGYISPGASINYVSKKPQFQSGGSFSLRTQSYDFYKPTFDIYGPLSENLAFRVVSSLEKSNSFRETVKSERISNYASFLYEINENSNITYNIDYLKDERPMDFGLPIFHDRIITGYKMESGKSVPIYLQTNGTQQLYSGLNRNRFLGSTFNNRTSHQLNSNLNYKAKLNDNWNINASTAISFSDYDYVQTGSGFRNILEQDGNDIKITRTLEQGYWEEKTFAAQANLAGKFNIASVSNNISISVDYDNRLQNSDSYNQLKDFDFIYLKDKNKAVERSYTSPEKSRLTETRFKGIGLSVQNLLNLTDQLNLLISGRLDIVDGYTENNYLLSSGANTAGTIAKQEHNASAFTPSFGLSYKFNPLNSLYMSYTNSFSPNSRGYLDINDKILEPYYSDQFEFGSKNTFLNKIVDFNLSFYQINDKSYFETVERVGRYEISSGVIYKGVELELAARISEELTVSANYTFIDAKYQEGGSRKAGTRPQQTPEHQGSFWASYKFFNGFMKNFSFNLQAQYTGERLGNDYFAVGSRNPDDIHPYLQRAYTLLNLGASYKIDPITFSLKISNLTDEFVFNSYRYGSVNPIAPRQYSLSLNYKL